MAKGYWVISVDITDPEAFKAYINANAEVLSRYGASFLARAGQSTAVEGAARARNSILEFPSYQAALECWNSPAYQAVKTLRENAAEMDVVVLEGL